MTFNDRIREARKNKKLTQEKLGALVGLAKTTIAGYENGHSEPNMNNLYKIMMALDVDANYLFQDEMSDEMKRRAFGDNYASNAWSTPLVEAYASNPVPTQENVCKLLDIPHVIPGVADNTSIEEDDEDPDPFRTSVQAAAAGTGVYLGPEEFVTILVEAGCLPRNASFGVPVSGDSMEPKYHDGDILIVSKEKADIGHVGVFTMDGKGYVKILRNGYLESLNSDYDDIPMTPDIICNGAVIGVLDKDCIVEE
ncbi:XRE family transcriptional regulator [Eubacteriales bacterium OttesenSCG-928-A19]|nr:XRE family transcriptional regulator [Eubacteriales bacterium OttesenSCG-928-A19]